LKLKNAGATVSEVPWIDQRACTGIAASEESLAGLQRNMETVTIELDISIFAMTQYQPSGEN